MRPAIPADCQVSDYDQSGAASTGRPECGWTVLRLDFSKPGVLITYQEHLAVAKPALTAAGDLSGGLTPQQWADNWTAGLATATFWAQPVSAGTTYRDLVTASDYAATITGNDLDLKQAQVQALPLDDSSNQTAWLEYHASTATVDSPNGFEAWNKQPFRLAGVIEVTFAGPPVATTGTVVGNTVFWVFTGHESEQHITASGPVA